MLGPLPALLRLIVERIGLLWPPVMNAMRRSWRCHQLLVLQRRVSRPLFTADDRAILAVLSRAVDRARLAEVFLIVRPATVLGLRLPRTDR